MDFHIDTLLNFPHATVEQCVQESGDVFLTLRLLNDAADCPDCGQSSEELHQSRPVLVRDLSIFGQATHLKIPRRQFYCRSCQRYFTESLSYVDKGRQYTVRYEEYIYQQVQLTTIEQVSRVEDLTGYQRKVGNLDIREGVAISTLLRKDKRLCSNAQSRVSLPVRIQIGNDDFYYTRAASTGGRISENAGTSDVEGTG